MCGEELKQCDHKELVELVRVADVEEKKKNHDVTHKLGRDREMPYESEVPFHKQEGATIVKMVAEDFVERVIENGAKSDVLVYFYFPPGGGCPSLAESSTRTRGCGPSTTSWRS